MDTLYFAPTYPIRKKIIVKCLSQVHNNVMPSAGNSNFSISRLALELNGSKTFYVQPNHKVLHTTHPGYKTLKFL